VSGQDGAIDFPHFVTRKCCPVITNPQSWLDVCHIFVTRLWTLTTLVWKSCFVFAVFLFKIDILRFETQAIIYRFSQA